MSNQRIFLGDYFLQSPLYYHAVFDHISHHKRIPTVLLKDLYIVDEKDHPVALRRKDLLHDKHHHTLVADHVWIDLDDNWFKLPNEVLYGDEVTFKATVEQYPITRDNVIRQRNEIWENVKIENNNLKQIWKENKSQYHGQIRNAKYQQLQAEIRQNIQLARKKQKEIALVDYGLSSMREIKIVKLQPIIEYKDIHRIKYSRNKLKKYNFRYTQWLSNRTEQYKLLLSRKKS